MNSGRAQVLGRRCGTCVAVAVSCIAAAFAQGDSNTPAVTRPARPATICYAAIAGWHEKLAATEIRRYAYLRTGAVLPVTALTDGVPTQDAVVVAVQQDPGLGALRKKGGLAELPKLGPAEFALRSATVDGHRVLLLIGGDGVGALYAAYRFAEHLGVRFYLHGDVVPDERIPLAWPALDETHRPLFALRGIQPFHDFPEGPDWWNLDDYRAYIAQLPKLRMNFIGLHTYPEGGPNAEPTVWIGLPEDALPDGRVRASYPASYQNTRRGNWGYEPKPTARFVLGADQLFERDDYGADVMGGLCPEPREPNDSNRLFDDTADLLRGAFTWARQLGVKTCVGTETPLTIPKAVQERLRAAGKDPLAADVRQKLYEGIFTRIARAYPIDYYWFWTPEGWTWDGTRAAQVQATLADVQAASAAATAVKARFELATCGWVLGPPDDRALFDKHLPKNIAVSCINRQVGMEPVERGFAQVQGRGKWAIPWLEDDPAMTAPQLWAGRMRADAVDARRYGCDGLLGIHWRTRGLSPTLAALAQAAWEQSWAAHVKQPMLTEGPVGGNAAAFPNNAIADTEDDPLYQTVRYDVSGYRFELPSGRYTVTLKFCEPHYDAPERRVFGVQLQGATAIDRLDVIAKVGRNRALDYTFPDIVVDDGWLRIDFLRIVELPAIAAIAITGAGGTRKVNCGGPAYQDYAADWPSGPQAPRSGLPTDDFYRDWARAEFGAEAGAKAAEILARIDGRLPRPADWFGGPGGLKSDGRPWTEAAKDYAFVDEFTALRPLVRGPGALERFEYWSNQLCYLRAIGKLGCAVHVLYRKLEELKASGDADARRAFARAAVVPAYREVAQDLRSVYQHLLATVSTPGEMGTVANWEQHILPLSIEPAAKTLREALGEDLPADLVLNQKYEGPVRILLRSLRPSIAAGERLALEPIVLSAAPVRTVSLHWRRIGENRFESVACRHVARGVYRVDFPAAGESGDIFEYYIEATLDGGQPARFPAAAPQLGQTVVVTPALDK
jgi:hypothetical protein